MTTHDFMLDMMGDIMSEIQDSLPIEIYDDTDWLKEEILLEQMWENDEYKIEMNLKAILFSNI